MLLKVKDLSYSIEEKSVLDKLNFTVQDKGITAILGTNGTGKSTLLSLIAGFLQPDEGDVIFNGKKVIGPEFKLIPGHPEIALVRQDMRLTPYATVYENLSHILRNYDQTGLDLEIKRLASLLGFEHYLDKTLKYLSGGEQQRVSIAAALASSPSLLLMDEPFSQTDVHLKPQLKKYLQDVVVKLGTSILFVTHDPQEALSIADKIMILHQGRIVEEGKGKELYYHPKLKLTAELTGPCNWIPENGMMNYGKAVLVEGMFLIRPEWIEISDNYLPNSVEARIVKIDFAGFYQQIHLNIAGNFTLLAYTISTQNLKEGQLVFVQM